MMKAKKKRRKSKQNNFVYENFILSLKYLKSLKNYFLVSLALFFLIAILGFIFPVFFEKEILELITKIIEETKDLGLFGLMSYIIFNNMQSAFSAMLFGLVLGIIPLVIVIFNGYVLGFVISKAVAIEGPLILWRLLPHGIFEIPAVMISVALGMKIGSFLFSTKSKSRTFLFILATFLIFLISSSILFIVMSVIFAVASGNLQVLENNDYFNSITNNPLVTLIFLVFWIGSIFLATKFLEKSDKKDFFELFKNSIRVFVLVIIPLLVIAGIIEGALIWLMG